MSIINPFSKRRKVPKGVEFDEDEQEETDSDSDSQPTSGSQSSAKAGHSTTPKKSAKATH